MKLSELVSHRRLLDQITPINTVEVTKKLLGPLLYSVQSMPLHSPDNVKLLESKYHLVDDAFRSYLTTVDEIKQYVDRLILDREPEYLTESYKLYESMCDDSIEYILNRRFDLPKEMKDFVHGRIQIYSNWKHPGMIIRPGLEEWIDSMVASDPLYVVDTDYNLLEPVKKRFNDQYVHRVRWNIVQESLDHRLLEFVPNDQIGVCLCYNFFHFKPFEIMKKYLEEIFDKLKPGGVAAITFNDCDRPGAVSNAERYFMCYTPGRMVKGLCENMGFEIVYSKELDAASTWLELKKPGNLQSLRGGQSLAKVVAKSK